MNGVPEATERGSMGPVGVVVVSMPWNMHDVVSLQVAALKAYLQAEGITAYGRHYHKDITALLDAASVVKVHEFGVGELVFGACYFHGRRELFVQEIAAKAPLDDVERLVDRVDQFTHAVVDDLLALNADVVGFSTTHVQLAASLYTARLLKQHRPGLRTVFGGLSLYGAFSRALLRHFPEVDFVVNGEGEVPLAQLAKVFAGDGELHDVPRLVFQNPGTGEIVESDSLDSLIDLEHSPTPDISDYFEVSLFGDTPNHQPKVCVESARGCRWGRCTFCIEGVPSRGGYRARSAARTVADVVELAGFGRTVDVVFTDPDMSRRRDVFEALAASEIDLRIDAEVSGLVDLPTLVSMKEAGLRSIQIGIESFSPRLLRRFAKGVQLIHYIELMRWCEMLQLELVYNIIVGAPFETQGDVDLSVANMSKLFFLPPPIISEFVVSIGSEIHANPGRFGISALTTLPEASVYPEEIRRDLGPLLSFHAGYAPVPATSDVSVDHADLVEAVKQWWEYRERGASLAARRAVAFVSIDYSVGDAVRTVTIDDPVEMAVLDACSIFARTERQIVDDLVTEDRSEVLAAVRRLTDNDLMLRSDHRVLALPLFERKFHDLIRSPEFTGRPVTQRGVPVSAHVTVTGAGRR